MKNYSFQILLFSTALGILGLWSVPMLNFDFSPSEDEKAILISYSHLESNSEFIEREITTILESVLAQIEDVKKISSKVSNEYGITKVEFDEDIILENVMIEIAQRLREIYAKLPKNTTYPQIIYNDASNNLINPTLISYTIAGPYNSQTLGKYALEHLKPKLSAIKGVQEVNILGFQNEEWLLEYDAHKINKIGVSVNEIEQLIIQCLSRQEISFVKTIRGEEYVTIPPKSIADVQNIRLKTSNGSINLSDIINAHKGRKNPKQFFRFNGQNSITLQFVAEPEANHLKTVSAIETSIESASQNLLKGCNLSKSYDSTVHLVNELSKIKVRTIWVIGILILLMILTYRSWSRTVLLLIGIFINLSVTSILYFLFDINLNLYALAGVTISFGIIFDNIILAAHHFEKQRDYRFFPILLSTSLTSIASLIFILFLPKSVLSDLDDFVKVIIINLIASLYVATFLIPILIEKDVETLKSSATSRKIIIKYFRFYQRYLMRIIPFKKSCIVGIIFLFGLPFFLLPKSIQDIDWYNKTLGSKEYTDFIRPWVDKITGGTLRLFMEYVYTDAGFRSPEETTLYVNARMPYGNTLQQMNEVISEFEKNLSHYQNQIKYFITKIPDGRTGQIKITFNSDVSVNFPFLLQKRLESAAIDLGGVSWNIYGIGEGYSNSTNGSQSRFQVIMKGYSKEELNNWVNTMSELLLKHPRITSVDKDANINWREKDKYEYILHTDARSLAQSQLNTLSIRKKLDEYDLKGRIIGFDGEMIPILWKNKDASLEINDLWKLQNEQLSINNRRFQLSTNSELVLKKKSAAIYKEDQQYVKLLKFEYVGTSKFGQKYLDECLYQMKNILPLGYTAEQRNSAFFQIKNKEKYGLVLIGIFAIFFITTIHFESFYFGGMIISLIPASFIGVFVTFYCFSFPFDQGGYASFFLLSGISINSLIILISEYVYYLKKFPEQNHLETYLHTFRNNITPITLSTVSTILGLLPFLIHGSQEVFWFALSVGTIGGLIFTYILLITLYPIFIVSHKY